ncbi:NUDIX domain-containing protein [Terrabacter sp. NPDC080008]|uniref:NUDIX hydrolase n=1 Tax=Terrabacter sp. NPDC080008 TaxID=3155176 RepID=UPI00344D76C6
MHFSEYDTRLAAYAAIVDEEQRLLLTWWNGEGRETPCWTLPGGRVEYEESLVEAVEREVLEETGYVVRVGRPLAAHSFTAPAAGRDGRPYKSVRILFSASIVGGSLGTTEVGGSTDFAQWMPLNRIKALDTKAEIVDVAYDAIVTDSPTVRPGSTLAP